MKPGLSEIFSALEGVIQAGVTLVKEGHSTSHPLADLSVRAAKLSYDMRTRLLQSEIAMPILQDNIAKICLNFLSNADHKRIMKEHEDVGLSSVKGPLWGNVKDVSVQISSLLVREQSFAEDRPVDKVMDNGTLKQTFTAGASTSQNGVEKTKAPKQKRKRPSPISSPVKEPAAPAHALV